MLASNAGIEAAAMAVILNLAAIACSAIVAAFSLRRARRSRSNHRSLYAAMAAFAGAVILANLVALAAPLGFWRLVTAYGAVAAVILWAMVRGMLPQGSRTS